MPKCPRCKGKGTQALHGMAITADEWNGPDWGPDEQDSYLRGDYDTPCSLCKGHKTFLDEEELQMARVEEHERKMGY